MALPTKILFIDENYIRANTAVNAAVDATLMEPCIWLAQEKYIQASLGTDLYQKLKTEIDAGTLAGDYLTLHQNYVMDATLWWTMSELYFDLQVKHNNGSLAQRISDDASPIDTQMFLALVERARNNAKFYSTRLEEYLCSNSSLFTEYTSNTSPDISPGTSGYSKGPNRFGHSGRGHYPYHGSIYRPYN